jgi:uncharacterized protein (TIGR02646 family)
MLGLTDPGLGAATLTALAASQQEVDAAGGYAAQVVAAKDLFPKHRGRAYFRPVKAGLAAMCAGAQRCCYCEDSVGDEVEHIKPKDLYPEVVFVWDNYVYACGPCNGGKNNKFAVINRNGEKVIVTRPRRAPVRKPAAGKPAFLNPRDEDPLAYLDLEIVDTYMFLPREGLSGRDEFRAEFTIEALKLNRDVLTAARRNAYGSYRARLLEYRVLRDDAVPPAKLGRLRDGITSMPHPTVWREIQRQQEWIPELRPLFADVPEALGW